MAAFFGPDGRSAYSVAKDCAVFVWAWEPDLDSAAHAETPGGGSRRALLASDDVLMTRFGSGGGGGSGFGGRPGLGDEASEAEAEGGSEGEGAEGEGPMGATLHPALGKWRLHSKHFLWDQVPATGNFMRACLLVCLLV